MSREKLYWLFGGLSAAGYVWLGWNLASGEAHSLSPVVCIFKAITGYPCPSCGSTRSLVVLSQGHVWESLQMNPVGILLALALLLVPLWILVDVVGKRDSFYRRYRMMEGWFLQRRWLSVSAVAIILANWCWNISKGL